MPSHQVHLRYPVPNLIPESSFRYSRPDPFQLRNMNIVLEGRVSFSPLLLHPRFFGKPIALVSPSAPLLRSALGSTGSEFDAVLRHI
jgi:hypothetical protein